MAKMVDAARRKFDIPATLVGKLQAGGNGMTTTAEIILVALPARNYRPIPGLDRGLAFGASIQVLKTIFR